MVANSALLEGLKETVRLIEKIESEGLSQDQRSELLKEIVDKILPSFDEWGSIYLQSEASMEVVGQTGLYERVEQNVKNSNEYADRGFRLYNQPMENRKDGEVCEIWLLRSGHFLLVKTKSCWYNNGYYSGYRDEVWYPATWKWIGEAVETADPAELSAHLDEVIGKLASFALDRVLDALYGVKEVEDSQREVLFYVLEVLLSRKRSIRGFFENLSHESISVIGAEGLGLLSKDPEFHMVSSDVLAKFGKDDVEPLLKIFNNSIREEYRSRIAEKMPFTVMEALGKIGYDKKVAELLVQSLVDELDKTSCPPIWSSQKEKLADIVKLLGMVSEASVVEHLIRALQEYREAWPDKVLYEAIIALGERGDERAYLPMAKAWPRVYYYKGVSEALQKIKAKLTERSVEPLIQALNPAQPSVCEWAITGLGVIGSERATEPLIGILFDEKADRRLRVQAARALRRIGNKKSIDALTQVYKKDKNMREVVGEELDMLGKRPKFWRFWK